MKRNHVLSTVFLLSATLFAAACSSSSGTGTGPVAGSAGGSAGGQTQPPSAGNVTG
jgi:uncharacterized membrane protein